MYIDNFNFELPPELIAQYPLPERTQSRLLTLNRATGKIAHQKFIDLPDLLSPGDLLIFNDTKVIPARLFGVKTSGGKVEILIERILDQHRILAHIKGSKSLKIGACIQLENNFNAEIIDQHNNLWELKFCEQRPILEILKTIGHIPLPPYIQRSDELLDQERYQTVYAKNEGAVAAPTAGLHFDENLLQKLISRGIETAYITLHVGAGTFQPVRTENIKDHKMHAETFEISPQVCAQIIKCKQRGNRVIAVGTTVVRSLETMAKSNEIKPYSGETDIFIYPGYQFYCIDAMITNFHLPKSTLLMLVCAFAGYENVMSAYQTATEQHYRFFSYGDAMFIL